MKRWIAVVAFFVGGLLVAPVAAQQVVRIFGTTSGGSILAALVDSSGRLIVELAGGSVSPSTVLAGDGSVGAPSYSFTNDPDTGFYKPGAGELAATVNGVAQYDLFANSFRMVSSMMLGWASGDPTATAMDTCLSRGAANRIDVCAGDTLQLAAGTTTSAPLTIPNGTNLTAAAANAIENDGASFYKTQDTTNGRTTIDGWNHFRLTGSGTGITTIADFFGATGSGIPLVANGIYEIEWFAQFSQATAGTATWTIVTATTALASLTGRYDCTNIAGIGAVGAPQQAGINVTGSSSTAFPVTGTMATAVTHQCTIKVVLQAGNGASNTRLRLTMSAGTATPLINSYFRVRRLPGANIGTFAS